MVEFEELYNRVEELEGFFLRGANISLKVYEMIESLTERVKKLEDNHD